MLTNKFVTGKLNKNLFEIKTNFKIPKRKLGVVMSDNTPSFTVKEFIKMLKEK